MKPLLFVDNVTTLPYDSESLHTRALTGTVSTVIKVAEKLSERIPVVIAHSNRQKVFKSNNVTYTPLMPSHLTEAWEAIIVLRDPTSALNFRTQFKKERVWLWMHDYFTITFLMKLKTLIENDIGIITVSNYHHKELLNLYLSDSYLNLLPNVRCIYNPIDDNLLPDKTPVNKNKLVFTSTYIKGLANTINTFKLIKERHPQFELYITDPGQMKYDVPQINGVHYLGSLPQHESIRHVRNALCLFSLNHVYPETFGLSQLEANAVGTPVLTHPFGALPEILSNPEQFVNTHHQEEVITQLMKWHNGERPEVTVNETFRLSSIIKKWEDLLFNIH